ncbi:MAG: Holliday junction branch migration protein RuvA [Bacteroidales bacterium]|nr:Holliday junction branch migration protein RuvA [Bacteroidales bacterium]
MLYGFADEEERKLFRHLISVSGVGANTARLILSSLSPNELYEAIISNNVSVLQSIKGIGSKTAQRIIVDLQDKLEKEKIPTEKLGIQHNTKKDEALSGLIILGFNKNTAEKALNRILQTENKDLSVEQLIKSALKIL